MMRRLMEQTPANKKVPAAATRAIVETLLSGRTPISRGIIMELMKVLKRLTNEFNSSLGQA